MNSLKDFLINKRKIINQSDERIYIKPIDKRISVINKEKYEDVQLTRAFSGNHSIKVKVELDISREKIIFLSAMIKMTDKTHNDKEILIEYFTDNILFQELIKSHKIAKSLLFSNFHYQWNVKKDKTECVITMNRMVLREQSNMIKGIDIKAVAMKALATVQDVTKVITVKAKEMDKLVDVFKEDLKEYQLKRLNDDYLSYSEEDVTYLFSKLEKEPYLKQLMMRLELLAEIKKDNEVEKESLFNLFKKKEVKKYNVEDLILDTENWETLCLGDKTSSLLMEKIKMKYLLLHKSKYDVFGVYFMYCIKVDFDKMLEFLKKEYDVNIRDEYLEELKEFILKKTEKIDGYLNFLLNLENNHILEREEEILQKENEEKKDSKLQKLKIITKKE